MHTTVVSPSKQHTTVVSAGLLKNYGSEENSVHSKIKSEAETGPGNRGVAEAGPGTVCHV